MSERKGEDGPEPTRIPFWRMMFDHSGITSDVLNYQYQGSGTKDDPHIVTWIPNDPRNPMLLNKRFKWSIAVFEALSTTAVALVSSAYTGGMDQIIEEFGIDHEVAILGVALYVLGFAVGPLLWAPLGELFGRQMIFFITFLGLTAFNCGAAGSPNAQTLIVLRFLAGSFGASTFTNAGGVIADIFEASDRGLAMGIYSTAPFLGPVTGPIIGGFLGEAAGWRWILGFLGALTGFFWILGCLLVPETYAVVLLRRRAEKLSKITGKVYMSRKDAETGEVSVQRALGTALSRPWILLVKEPIVLLLSLYMAIIYGTLYLFFAAFPIVYQQHRGWDQGIGSLPFLGLLIGMIVAIIYCIPENKRYIRIVERNDGLAPPEARLLPALVGSIPLPVGLFWFAWTNGPEVHWLASVAAGIPFGFGMVLVFLSVMNYLVDAYTIFAASVLGANTFLRSLFGAVFPLIATYMYNNLGIHWASTILAFLSLACVPFPFLFYRYGAVIRQKCAYAAEAAAHMKGLQHDEGGESSQSEQSDGTMVEIQRGNIVSPAMVEHEKHAREQT
ncbi:unnamed protein product [Clonostachys solani]|uniref:Major facilitator superfamily (MFS) profile domain-containing protein n=1 Tax=Clonostachys solani TaxID=160281 RepID=A0A9N9ZJ16_9HYPO|nr:unnamed protein product [Clonostachys solani]